VKKAMENKKWENRRREIRSRNRRRSRLGKNRR
jgi:hypothetical protein